MPSPYQKVDHAARDCAECGHAFKPKTVRSTFCSQRCAWRTRERKRGFPCSQCGRQMYRSKDVAETPTCRPCRRSSPTYSPKGALKPEEAWACVGCGVESRRPATRGQRPAFCRECRSQRTYWIGAGDRRRIYARDAWICWLCEEPVDRSLIGTKSEWRPSLDHVVPRAKGGDSSEDNLKLAHFWCNVVRGNDRCSPEVFRASA